MKVEGKQRDNSDNELLLLPSQLSQAPAPAMKTVKEFLESSTIHGLVYISTTKRLVRLLWLCVVILGFSGAGVLIHQSFSSWTASPVSTTIEVLPITELDLPNVTVCPPKNTFITLNPDLVMARNVTLDDEQRQELIDSVPDSVYDSSLGAQYVEFLEYRTNTGQDNYRDWYIGITKVDLPRRDVENGINIYSLETTKLEGTFTSPDFPEPFDENKFDPKLKTELYITISVDMEKLVPSGYASLIMEINYDIEESVEFIRFEEQEREISEELEGNQQNKVKESFITNTSLTLEPNLNYVRKEYGLIEDMESNR